MPRQAVTPNTRSGDEWREWLNTNWKSEKAEEKTEEKKEEDDHRLLAFITGRFSLLPVTMVKSLLLVCSIGNPGTYINTLHSAGHTVLNALAHSLGHPPFKKSRDYGNGYISEGPDFTLWQSSSLMNASGAGVAKAWKHFLVENKARPVHLVVIHDELQRELGEVRLKNGSTSPGGHNGLKGINQTLKETKYTRIGIGIGRPESRAPNVVSAYVLRTMTPEEKATIEGCVGTVELEMRRLASQNPDDASENSSKSGLPDGT